MDFANMVQQPLQETGVPNTPNLEIALLCEEIFPAPAPNPQHSIPWSEQRWKDILSKEEETQQCSRCKEIGHALQHCPYPIVYQKVQDGEGSYRIEGKVLVPAKGKNRCGRCGRRGHNRRTCHGPVFF